MTLRPRRTRIKPNRPAPVCSDLFDEPMPISSCNVIGTENTFQVKFTPCRNDNRETCAVRACAIG